LHAAQAFGGDLGSFLRSFTSTQENALSIQNDTLQSSLESMTGRDWSSFFDNYINGRQEIEPSSFSSLNVAQPPEDSSTNGTAPQTSTSVMSWIVLGIVLGVVFLIPFIFEPYTMRPRKPGFLKKKLGDDDDKQGGGGLLKRAWWAEEEDEDSD
jgi:hypothetical protein